MAATATDGRWLDYELDFAKLLDLPLMTDMRSPLTMEFHKAKLRADLLRTPNAVLQGQNVKVVSTGSGFVMSTPAKSQEVFMQ